MKKEELIKYGLIVLAVYIVYRFLKGISAPPPGSITGGTAQDQPVNSQNLTWDANSFKSFADQIETGLFGGLGLTEDDELVGQVLSQMNTNDDVQQLINDYGVRGKGYIIQQYYNLPQSIGQYLDTDVKNRVNDIYRSKNIGYTWN